MLQLGALYRRDIVLPWGRESYPAPVEWGFDTETQDGKAVLLTIAGPCDASAELLFPRTLRECFDFLYAHARRFIAYNMDYDARALLKFLPRSSYKTLYLKETVDAGGLHVYYRPGKEIILSCAGASVSVYDCYPFFQRSLTGATESVFGRSRKLSVPDSWYRRMEAVLRSPRTRSRCIAYARQDARAVLDLWNTLDAQYSRLGVSPGALSRPISPGSLASSYFGARIRFPRLDLGANWTARRAYAGARIEVLKRGYFPKVWAYDINSAYPYELSRLPDPRLLDPVQDKRERNDALYSVFRVRVSIPRSVHCPPVPLWDPEARSDLRIFPVGRFSGWYTGPEVKALARAGWLESIEGGYHLCGYPVPWLADLRELYRERKRNPEVSLAIKLVMNSLYGKMAQVDDRLTDSSLIYSDSRRVGDTFVSVKKHLSSTSNFFVAAYVLALCRLRLHDAARAVGPQNVVLFSTDGIVTTRPMPVQMTGSGFGEWGVKMRAGRAVVVGAGVYTLGDRDGWHDVTRSYSRSTTEPLRTILRTSRVKVPVVNRQVYSLADTATRGVPLNEFHDLRKVMSLNFDRKRIWERPARSGWDLLRHSIGSAPRIVLEEDKR